MLILQKEPLVYIRPYCCPLRFSLPSGKAPYHPVCTGPAADRYAGRPLPGGTASRRPSMVDCGKNRPLAVNFDRRRSISVVGGRLRRNREGKKKKKKERYLEPPSCPRDVAAHGSPASRREPSRPSLPADHFSPRAGSRDRGDGYVDFGRYETSNYFVAGSGPVDFVQVNMSM
ncbi:hypothetical protein BHM03_00048911 [Ensete ventricosum]|nr:hypothetical protein BHM03_00048911 [Ensete ventricosum]